MYRGEGGEAGVGSDSVGALEDLGKKDNSLVSTGGDSWLSAGEDIQAHSLEDPHWSLHRAWHCFRLPPTLPGMGALHSSLVGAHVSDKYGQREVFPGGFVSNEYGATAKEQHRWPVVTAAPRLPGGYLEM